MNRLAASSILSGILVLFLISVSIPQGLMAQTGRGIDLCDSWKFQEAEKVLREALAANPRDIQAAYYLGLSVLMQDKHNEALEILLKAKSDLDKAGSQARPSVPDEYQIQIALARTYLELKRYPEAWKSLESAQKEHPDSVDVHVYRGVYYMFRGDLQKAIGELDKSLSMDSNNAYANYYAGLAYLRNGNPSKAVDLFKAFLQLAPDAPEAGKAKALIAALC
jgi:tetratricopeptide (TPR) repeat protein